MDEPQVRETAEEARQGPRGHPVLYVLIVGLLLAVVAWVAAELYGEKADNKAGVNEGQTNNQVAPTSAPAGNTPVTNTPVEKHSTPDGHGWGVAIQQPQLA